MTDNIKKGGQQARRAAMLCTNPRFGRCIDHRRRRAHNLTIDQMPDGTHSPEDCADWLREACGVKSRAEIDHNDAASAMLDRIIADYSAWERQQRQRGNA